ncbi:MAG: phenylalanine--tRNA ligase subunit beta [Myxococcota bacterium]
MRVSLEWLKEFVTVEADAGEVAARLTSVGLEVGNIDNPGKRYREAKVAKIIKVEKLGDSQNLWLVDVAISETKKATVVAGVANFKPGDFVPFIPKGAKMPDGTTVESREFKGVSSDGVLCSLKELELGADHTGIWVMNDALAKGSKSGDSLSAALSLDDDVLEIELTPNRADCLGYIHIAREVAILFGAELRLPKPATRALAGDSDDHISVEVKAERACPVYTGRIITDLKVGASPWIVARRLIASGVRTINNLVDITNYILLEQNQPLHAFDLRDISGEKIIVRFAADGERFVTLDGEERKLKSTDLVIADAEKPVALAGIMGGLNSEVREDTREVLLEAAYFDPMTIRRTSSALGVRSESSHRFERGINYDGVLAASQRATDLFATIAGGTPSRAPVGFISVGHLKKPPIPLSAQRVGELIGKKIPEEQIDRILTYLGVETTETKGKKAYLPPPWRPDLERPIDLVEEIARHIGYDNIEATIPLPRYEVLYRAESKAADRRERLVNRIRKTLCDLGFYETVNYSFVSQKLLETTRCSTPAELLVRIENPLSEEHSHLRPSLLSGLLKSGAYNLSQQLDQQIPDLRLFELGTVFAHPEANAKAIVERFHLAAIWFGSVKEVFWRGDARKVDFFDMKGILEQIFLMLGIEAMNFVKTEMTELHPHKGAAEIIAVNNESVGFIGMLHPKIGTALEIDETIAVCELDCDKLIALSKKEDAGYKPVSKYPAIMRDFALLLDKEKGLEIGKLLIYIQVQLKKMNLYNLLEEINLFDVYAGDRIPKGKISVAIRLFFRAPDRTLTKNEVEDFMKPILEGLKRDFGAELRS